MALDACVRAVIDTTLEAVRVQSMGAPRGSKILKTPLQTGAIGEPTGR